MVGYVLRNTAICVKIESVIYRNSHFYCYYFIVYCRYVSEEDADLEEVVDFEKFESKPSKPKQGKFKGWLKKTFRNSNTNEASKESNEESPKSTISVTENHAFPKELVFDFQAVDQNELIGKGFFSMVHRGFLHLDQIRR